MAFLAEPQPDLVVLQYSPAISAFSCFQGVRQADWSSVVFCATRWLCRLRLAVLQSQNWASAAALAYRCCFALLRWSEWKWLSAVCKVRILCDVRVKDPVRLSGGEEQEPEPEALWEWSRFQTFLQRKDLWSKLTSKGRVLYTYIFTCNTGICCDAVIGMLWTLKLELCD